MVDLAGELIKRGSGGEKRKTEETTKPRTSIQRGRTISIRKAPKPCPQAQAQRKGDLRVLRKAKRKGAPVESPYKGKANTCPPGQSKETRPKMARERGTSLAGSALRLKGGLVHFATKKKNHAKRM